MKFLRGSAWSDRGQQGLRIFRIIYLLLLVYIPIHLTIGLAIGAIRTEGIDIFEQLNSFLLSGLTFFWPVIMLVLALSIIDARLKRLAIRTWLLTWFLIAMVIIGFLLLYFLAALSGIFSQY